MSDKSLDIATPWYSCKMMRGTDCQHLGCRPGFVEAADKLIPPITWGQLAELSEAQLETAEVLREAVRMITAQAAVIDRLLRRTRALEVHCGLRDAGS